MPAVHDPVSAIAETAASGQTAQIFADIRQTLNVPIVTAIWRGLAANPDDLASVWEAVKPLYASGYVDALADQLEREGLFPVPVPPAAPLLRAAGISPEALVQARTIVEAYNRSNILNLLALTALVAEAGEGAVNLPPQARVYREWPLLPDLLEKEQIAADDWALLERTIPIGAEVKTAALPTLWRHIVHWPALIQLFVTHFGPLHQDGTLIRAVRETIAFAESEAPRLGGLTRGSHLISNEARGLVQNYVGQPPTVARMATVGTCFGKWLSVD